MGRPLVRKHNWIATESQRKALGPLEIKFEQAANLISLNFDLLFNCDSMDTFRDGLLADKPVEAKVESAKVTSGTEIQRKLG